MSMSHLIDIDLPLSGDSIPTRSEQTHVLTPTLLHNGHVWARERYLPSDCDASVYALAKQGSLKAHGQLLDLFISDCRRGSALSADLAGYAAQALTELADQKRELFRQWHARQAGRKSNAGRPSPHALGEEHALALEALAADLIASRQIGVVAHAFAFELLEAERQTHALQLDTRQQKGKQPPRRNRGRRPQNAGKFDLAMEVHLLLKAEPQRSEARAIGEIAESLYKKDHPEADDLRSTAKKEILRDRLKKRIAASYYLLKPYLQGEQEPWLGGLVPLELMLDD